VSSSEAHSFRGGRKRVGCAADQCALVGDGFSIDTFNSILSVSDPTLRGGQNGRPGGAAV